MTSSPEKCNFNKFKIMSFIFVFSENFIHNQELYLKSFYNLRQFLLHDIVPKDPCNLWFGVLISSIVLMVPKKLRCQNHLLLAHIWTFFHPEKGLDHVAENILSYLDASSLCAAELVCREWQRVISEGMLWKKLVERKVRTDSLWRGLAERRGW